jgi:hypothetical protein
LLVRDYLYVNMIRIRPLCVFDFYVHSTSHGKGHGRELFDLLLEDNKTEPRRVAVDNPSSAQRAFFEREYGLREHFPETSHFVVFKEYFEGGELKEGTRRIEAIEKSIVNTAEINEVKKKEQIEEKKSTIGIEEIKKPSHSKFQKIKNNQNKAPAQKSSKKTKKEIKDSKISLKKPKIGSLSSKSPSKSLSKSLDKTPSSTPVPIDP